MKMNEKLIFYNKKYIKEQKNIIRNKYIRGCAKIFNFYPVAKKYDGFPVLNRFDTNEMISTLIDSNQPFAVCRFGSTELFNLTYFHMKNIAKMDPKTNVWAMSHYGTGYLEDEYSFALNSLTINSGFFPKSEEYLEQFYNLYVNLIPDVDLLGTWNIYLEKFFLDSYMKSTKITNLYYLEPWFSNNPWSAHLAGKKVLVIHPFEQTIIQQYENNRQNIFKDKNVLPEFELKTLKAIQTIANNKDDRFNNWFEALDYMYNKAMTIDFDIAIIGCGAYGMPLALKLKRAGKQAIHLGGATQLMFGIKGSRWEQSNYPTKIGKYFNEYWVRPSDNDKVQGQEKVEDSCYW